MKMNEKRTAFILAAGLGTRLEELTHNKPKALVELNNKTLLEIAIDNLIWLVYNIVTYMTDGEATNAEGVWVCPMAFASSLYADRLGKSVFLPTCPFLSLSDGLAAK